MMHQYKKYFLKWSTLVFLWFGFLLTNAQAALPLWTFEPLTVTTVAVPENSQVLVQYRVTNQSARPHTLIMTPIRGIEQKSVGSGVCKNIFRLGSKNSCVLSLQINGKQLNGNIIGGPIVCEQNNPNQCYRPGASNILRISHTPAIKEAVLTVTGSPLIFTVNGIMQGSLTLHNTSTQVTATGISSIMTGTALDGHIIETGNTCNSVPPGGSCTLTYSGDNTIIPQTNFTIQGTNTKDLLAAIAIQSGSTLAAINPNTGVAAGGTSFILTGSGLLGTTSVTFDGIDATNINIVNATTVTGVTPAHAVGSVDVIINTPAGGATLINGYTYVTTSIGDPSGGGVIACLDGGLNDFIAATVDVSTAIEWGGSGIDLPGAQDVDNGKTNTDAIVAEFTGTQSIPLLSYAAGLCKNYEVDSEGNTNCQPGNACYNDWFLPASNQLLCLYTNRNEIGGFENWSPYWTSNQLTDLRAQYYQFANGFLYAAFRTMTYRVRCIRYID